MGQPGDAGVRITTRERLLITARELIERDGWASVSMSGVASATGVSRQTAHNLLRSKHGLAQALALRELETFLEALRTAMSTEESVRSAIEAGCRTVLEMAAESVLVRSIFGAVDNTDLDFLTILTTESRDIVLLARGLALRVIEESFPDLPVSTAELSVVIEMVVRLVLSNITRPDKAAADAAADIAWSVERIVFGTADR